MPHNYSDQPQSINSHLFIQLNCIKINLPRGFLFVTWDLGQRKVTWENPLGSCNTRKLSGLTWKFIWNINQSFLIKSFSFSAELWNIASQFYVEKNWTLINNAGLKKNISKIKFVKAHKTRTNKNRKFFYFSNWNKKHFTIIIRLKFVLQLSLK
jgi:hypothetical protein